MTAGSGAGVLVHRSSCRCDSEPAAHRAETPAYLHTVNRAQAMRTPTPKQVATRDRVTPPLALKGHRP